MKVKNARHAHTDARRKEIIEAALTCFSELGFTEATMAEIRRRSNASTGSIYHHFKSKDQLALEVYLEGIRNYQEGFLKVLEKQEWARDGIRGVINYHLNWVNAHPQWTRYLFQKAPAGFMASAEDVFAGLNAEFMMRCSRWFAAHVKAGAIRRMPPDMYVSVLLGPLMEYTRLFMAGRACTPPEHAVEMLASSAWRCLGAGTKEQ